MTMHFDMEEADVAENPSTLWDDCNKNSELNNKYTSRKGFDFNFTFC